MKQYKVTDSDGEHIGDFKTNGKVYGHSTSSEHKDDTRFLIIYYRYLNQDWKPATFSFATGKITKGCSLPVLCHNIEMQINDLFYMEYR